MVQTTASLSRTNRAWYFSSRGRLLTSPVNTKLLKFHSRAQNLQAIRVEVLTAEWISKTAYFFTAVPSDSQLPAEAVAGEGDSDVDPRFVEGALVPFAHPYKCQGLTPSVCKIKSSPKSHSSSIRQAQADGLGLARQRLMDLNAL